MRTCNVLLRPSLSRSDPGAIRTIGSNRAIVFVLPGVSAGPRLTPRENKRRVLYSADRVSNKRTGARFAARMCIARSTHRAGDATRLVSYPRTIGRSIAINVGFVLVCDLTRERLGAAGFSPVAETRGNGNGRPWANDRWRTMTIWTVDCDSTLLRMRVYSISKNISLSSSDIHT